MGIKLSIVHKNNGENVMMCFQIFSAPWKLQCKKNINYGYIYPSLSAIWNFYGFENI